MSIEQINNFRFDQSKSLKYNSLPTGQEIKEAQTRHQDLPAANRPTSGEATSGCRLQADVHRRPECRQPLRHVQQRAQAKPSAILRGERATTHKTARHAGHGCRYAQS